MNAELRQLIENRLESDGFTDESWAGVVLAACDGRDALEAFLREGEVASGEMAGEAATRAADAYLTALTVEGFRGIGAAQILTLNAGPGLTLIIGRNGSGKSSFAEALEVLFTGDSKRWSERSKVWKDGWRNLHQPHPTSITAELLVAGKGATKVSAVWHAEGAFDDQQNVVQPKGKPKTTLLGLGWNDALVLYRPFLSYNELGSMLDEGPSKLYDALSKVLGLEDLVSAQQVLVKARTERQGAWKDALQRRDDLRQELIVVIAQGSDDRASEGLDALSSGDWGLDRLTSLLSPTAPKDDSIIGILNQASALAVPDQDLLVRHINELRQAHAALNAVAATDSDRSRKLAQLLEAALALHRGHALRDCPVCGTTSAIGPTWAESTQQEITRLKERAAESDQVHRNVDAVRQQAVRLLSSPPAKLLEQLDRIGIARVTAAREAWTNWNAGARLSDLAAVADHIDTHQAAFTRAIGDLKKNAAAELQRRQDRWTPVASAIAQWIPSAHNARTGEEELPFIKEAEAWLKGATADIRNERFAPIADEAMDTWRLLRQNSNVELGRIELTGTGAQRRVKLDVTVDGVSGAALGVMSQGELHSLALSLFLPKASLPESPFRFVVIDDPVQSMDPARVDGLARVLEQVARTRQVVVFTHDTRLPDAVRRLGIKATHVSVTRRPGSVVEVRSALDPVRAHIEDALALAYTAELPRDVLQRVVPGFCRSALEASCMLTIRRRRLAAGQSHAAVEQEIEKAQKLTPLAALALFDDRERGGDVMKRLNQFGSWAGDVFRDCKEGAHGSSSADFKQLIENTESLCERILELK
jgi:recombinational DNA repair ATPase RecF